jgi:ABC-type glycerol-3-phosphate transport system permease component
MIRNLGYWIGRQQLPTYGVLGILGLLMLYPMFFMFVTSLKTNAQFYYHFLWFAVPLHWSNYVLAFSKIWRYMLNSVFVTGMSTLLVLILSSTAAYAFARLSFPARDIVYYAIIGIMMVPFLLMFVPLFILVRDLGLLDTYWGLILPYAATGQALSIFILRTFFANLPNDMFEACRIDGGSEWQAFFRIALPLSKPVLGTVAILQVIATWNDYLWPLVVIDHNSLRTLALGMVAFTGRYAASYGPLMAGYMLGSLPLILLLIMTSRTFMEGLTAGALKF